MLLCLLGSLGAGAAAMFLHHRTSTLDAPQWVVPSRALAAFSLLAMGAALMRGGWYQRFVSGMLMLAVGIRAVLAWRRRAHSRGRSEGGLKALLESPPL